MTTQPQDHQSSEFVYTLADGRKITLPKFSKLMTFGRARRLRHLSESEQVFALVEEVCDEEQLAALDSMDVPETERFFSEWQADSGVALGE